MSSNIFLCQIRKVESETKLKGGIKEQTDAPGTHRKGDISHYL